MSVENGKVCYNCRHNIRSKEKKYNMIVCHCDIDNAHLSYPEVMTGWCRHWAKDNDIMEWFNKWAKEVSE